MERWCELNQQLVKIFFYKQWSRTLLNVDWKETIIEWMKQTVPLKNLPLQTNTKWSICTLCVPVISMIIYTSYRRTCQMWIQASSKKEVKHTVRVYSSGHLYMYFVLSVILNAGHFFLSPSRKVKKYAKSMCLKILVRHIFDDLSFMSPCVVSWTTEFFFLYLGWVC